MYAHSTVDGANHVDITTTDKAELAGTVINVIADAPELEKSTISRDGTAIANTIVQKVWTKVKNVVEKVVRKVSKIPIIGWFVKWVTEKVIEWIDVLVEVVLYSDAEVYKKGTYTSSGNVDLNGKIHVGGGAAGIFVDIFGDLLDNISVSTSGLDADLKDQAYTVEDGKVILKGIYNDDQGTLNVHAGKGSITGKVTTYTNGSLPEATITNHTDFDLVLKNLTLVNTQVPAPVVRLLADGSQTFTDDKDTETAEGTESLDYGTYGEHIPQLRIVSEKGGDIIFDSDKENGGMKYADVAEGNVYIVMNGGSLLTANGAYLAANTLYIGEGTGTDGNLLAGPDQIGNSKEDPFQVYVFDIDAYAGLENVAAPIAARPSDIKAHAAGDIFLALTPVKEWMTRADYESVPAEGEVRTNLNLAEIIGGTDSTVYVNVLAAKKTCANRSDLAEEYVISIPRSAMEFLTADRSGAELTEVQICDADGQPTSFWLTADGKLLNKDAEVTFNADTYLTGENENYDTYHLPNGTVVITDKTGKLAYITTEKGEAYDLSGYQITEVDGNVTITVVSTNADASEWSQKITFKDGKARMEIGVNGATTYIETSGFSEDGFGWNLPNGVKIYFKQVFIDEETSTVNPGTAIRTETDANGKTVSYIALENLDANRSFWHVVKVTEQSGSYTFQEGYLYSKTALTEKTVVFYQTLDDAKLAVQTVTSSLKSIVERVLGRTLTAEGASTAYVANAVSTAVADSYKGYLTDNLKVSVSTTIYESEGQYSPDGNGGQTLTGYKTLWSINVLLVADEDETVVLRDLADVYNSTVSQKAVGGPETMIAEAAGTKDAASETVISNADGSVYFKKNYAGNWVAYVKPGSGKTVYSFDMNPTVDGWYAAVAPSGVSNKRKQAYDDNLKDVFITLDGSTQAMLKQSAEGAIDGDNLNGGYVKLNGAVRFVDSKDHTDKGILLVGGHIVAVFPDGHFGYVAGDGLNQEGTDKSNASITISPEMRPRTYYDENGNLQEVKDAAGNTIYDVQFREEGAVRADGSRTYKYRITRSDGSAYTGELYAEGYNSAFTVTDGIIELTDAEAAALVEGAYSVNINEVGWAQRFIGDNVRLQLGIAPMYTYASDIIVVAPVQGTNGALLHFTEQCNKFEARRDSNGLAILDRYTRIVDAYAKESSYVKDQIKDLEQGTILFLNEDGTIAAYLAPDGSFRVYDGTRTQNDAADGERVYADYSVGDDGKLDVTLSKNSSTNFMEVAHGTDSSNDDNVLTSVYGLHTKGEDLHNGYNYKEAHYFGYSADGTLIELVREDRYFDYDEDGSLRKIDDAAAALETGFALKNDRNVLMTIIDNVKEDTSGQKGLAVYVMYDNTALDSEGNVSGVTSENRREYEDLNEEVNTNIGTVEADDFTLDADSNVTGGTIETTGDTDITASGNVGTADQALTVNADGSVSVDAKGSTVNLRSDQDMMIDSISSADGTGSVTIDAAGNITDVADDGDGTTPASPAIAAADVNLTAGGTVGEQGNALDTSADTLSIQAGSDVNAANDKDVTAESIASQNGSVTLAADGDVTVESISSPTSVDIKANGNVTGKGTGPNITADSLNIDTTGAGDPAGNISGEGGANGDALATNVNNFSANAGNITIDNNNGEDGNLTIGSVTGKDVSITTSGTLTGSDQYDPNITADNLTTASGKDTSGLSANVTGKVDQTSKTGSISGKINGVEYTNKNADDIANMNADANVPKNQIILAKAVASKKKVTLKWTAAEGATGYIIYWNGKVYKEVTSNILSLVMTGLKKKKVYNFRIVAVRNGVELGTSLKSYTGIQLKKALPKKVKAKGKFTIKLKKSKKLAVSVIKKGAGALLKKGRQIRFLLSEKGIIKISKAGKIKALKKGKVTLYSIAVNGVWKKTVVTVK